MLKNWLSIRALHGYSRVGILQYFSFSATSDNALQTSPVQAMGYLSHGSKCRILATGLTGLSVLVSALVLDYRLLITQQSF